jgi:hypothetical protein
VGDSNNVDNEAIAQIRVVDSIDPTHGPTDNIWDLSPGSPMFLILILVVIIGIAMTVRYMLSLRSEQTTRDLYESIYGDDIVGDQSPSAYPDDVSGDDKGFT